MEILKTKFQLTNKNDNIYDKNSKQDLKSRKMLKFKSIKFIKSNKICQKLMTYFVKIIN